MAETGRMIGEYMVGKQIGSGSFSVVWHARHRIHGTEVAIKEISMSRLNKKLQDSLLSEIFILKQIIHPNIIRLLEIIEVPGKIHLVLEYCRGGDLFMYIQRHGRVPEATAKHFMLQLAAGLKILRENNLIHRDLKPQNLLVSTNDSNSVLKIADFGFASLFSVSTHGNGYYFQSPYPDIDESLGALGSLQPRGLAETLCGSPLYMAPEIMQLQKYDAKADLWSVGTILYQLVTGKTPFTGNNQIQLLQNIIKATELRFPPDLNDLSSECVDLCQKLLRRNPVERLTFDEFFNHPFLQRCQQNEISRGRTTLRRVDSQPLLDDLIKNREESSSDDCLPFLLDDDSSGPDGSPSFLGRRSSMKSSYGFSPDSRKEADSNTVKYVDSSSRHTNHTAHRMQTSSFMVDSSRQANYVAHPPISMEQRPVSFHSRVMDSSEFIDQDYVLVSGPPLYTSSSSTNMSKPTAPQTKPSHPLQASVGLGTRSSAPVPIVGQSTRNTYYIGSLESQCSAPSATSQGSLDTADVLEQPSSDFTTRLRSLQECAASIKELTNEMIEAGRHLEAFSIQLVVLAVWKQALHICHTQAVSPVDGSPSQDIIQFKGSINNMNISPDFHEDLDAVSCQVLEEVSSEIKREFLGEVAHAEELAKFVEPGNEEMPDAMETIYQSALALGRHGAVDELMGDIDSAASSYSKAVRLLIFLLVEAPSLILNPPFSLTNSDRFRLRNYINILNDRQGVSRSQRLAVFKP